MKRYGLYSMLGHGGFLKMMAMMSEMGGDIHKGIQRYRGKRHVSNAPGTRGSYLVRKMKREQAYNQSLLSIGIDLRRMPREHKS